MTVLAFPSLQTIFDLNGKPVRDARVYFYEAGTLTATPTYRSADLGAQHTQPISSAANGRIPAVFVNTGSYRVRILDSTGALLEDVDAISGQPSSGGGGGISGTVDPNALLVTGDVVFNLKSGVRSGFVRLNGRSISSTLGAGSERANNDTQALFQYLWDAVPTLAVAGGRGGSGAADWAANKALDLPDLRGRGPLGADAMGATSANRLAFGLFASGSADVIGSSGGEAVHLLTVAEMPSHHHRNSTGVGAAASGVGNVFIPGSLNDSLYLGIENTGGDVSHNNLQPFLIGTWLMRL